MAVGLLPMMMKKMPVMLVGDAVFRKMLHVAVRLQDADIAFHCIGPFLSIETHIMLAFIPTFALMTIPRS